MLTAAGMLRERQAAAIPVSGGVRLAWRKPWLSCAASIQGTERDAATENRRSVKKCLEIRTLYFGIKIDAFLRMIRITYFLGCFLPQ
jgi:hypothetical protein